MFFCCCCFSCCYYFVVVAAAAIGAPYLLFLFLGLFVLLLLLLLLLFRVIFRDDLKGLPVLINLIDSTLYLSKESPKPDSASQEGRNEKEDPENVSCSKATSEGEDVKSKLQPPKPVTIRDQCYVLQSEVPDKTCLLLSEALKIVFNQTVNWREESEYNEVRYNGSNIVGKHLWMVVR